MIHGCPADDYAVILIGWRKGFPHFIPFRKSKLIVYIKTQVAAYMPDKAFNARRPQNRERARFRCSSPHHEQSWKTQTVICMEMGNSHDRECLKAQMNDLERYLNPFATVKKVEPPLVSYDPGAQGPSRQWHGCPYAQENKFHKTPPPRRTI
jgi:hypothetical protein